jgi:hypothetical protein
MKKSNCWGSVIYIGGTLAILYVSLACIVYRFRHPEQTETQLFLNILDALLWR